MPTLLTQQNLIIVVGVLLLTAPIIAKAAAYWVSSLVAKTTVKKDFEIETVVKLMQLRNDLDHQGAKNASAICKDLVFAIVYGDQKGG